VRLQSMPGAKRYRASWWEVGDNINKNS